MKILNYQAGIKVNVTPREALEKINRLAGWWARDFAGTALELEDVFTVHFGEMWLTCKVVDLVPNETMEWEIIDCHLPWARDRREWTNTNLIWKLAASKDSTQIGFIHVGLIPEMESYDTGAKGWDFFIKESLFPWLARNNGQPDENPWRCASADVYSVRGHGSSIILSPCH